MGKLDQILLEQLTNRMDLRASLSAIRNEIKEKDKWQEFDSFLMQNTELVLSFLKEEDPKTRKNTALLLGDMKAEFALYPLFQGFEEETQLFVKASYLEGIKELSFEILMPQLKTLQNQLLQLTLDDSNRKHVQEQLRILNAMILQVEDIKPHTYQDSKTSKDVLLLTNRNHGETLLKQVQEVEDFYPQEIKLTNQGVRIKTKEVLPLFSVRIFQELLFFIPGMKTVSTDPGMAAKQIADSQLCSFLKESHQGEFPFYFRVEVKSKMDLSKKSQFAKKVAASIETLTERKLINSPGKYEVELRFIEHQEQGFYVCVKLYTLQDERFSYRKQMIPLSMKPVNAALLVALAKPYMIEDANVLDPFCGVGTLLIERQIVVKGKSSYGIDLLEDAILKARENTQEAGQIIHFINRDFFDFHHEYLFDEIFTNMPFAIGRKTEEEIQVLYENFFQKAKEHLTKLGRLILYTHNKEYVLFYAKLYGYRILASYEIMRKEETFLIILDMNHE